MANQPDRLLYLFSRYREHTISPEEEDELMRWMSDTGDPSPLRDYLQEQWQNWKTPVPETQPDWDQLIKQIVSTPVISPVQRRNWRWRALAAACVLALLATGGLLLWRGEHRRSPTPSIAITSVTQGSSRATLSLDNGQTIILDSAHNGELETRDNAHVVKVKNGQLDYSTPATTGPELVYHTLTTPRGSQYQLRLPDGSMAWLNAASSIRYPVAFNGKDRKVEITGEVYFDIVKKPEQPFSVAFNGTTVEVLGTAFNIMAYPDESVMRTTLLAGSVRVLLGSKQQLLTPGEQAIVQQTGSPDNTIQVNAHSNTEQAIAWKTGIFNFDRLTLKEAMLQLARWYDVNVECPPALANKRFGGEMGRDLTLTQVLKLLNGTDLHFRLEDRTIIVY